ncbi:hypothetical protein BX661DRAFT_188718 [Kickxella alabastrina]|uniref:uncharacterized protein n=1 Tax=Kickxella alabastrina TaxID=61397 RepID=UPI002220D031|nr:uncharacterized protein BX661DRAFT_188718 [Kickxella alabastrina]KAI7820878.1 hypothetical protein BX661DRAFT_188718 [Kickxella alabastrina]
MNRRRDSSSSISGFQSSPRQHQQQQQQQYDTSQNYPQQQSYNYANYDDHSPMPMPPPQVGHVRNPSASTAGMTDDSPFFSAQEETFPSPKPLYNNTNNHNSYNNSYNNSSYQEDQYGGAAAAGAGGFYGTPHAESALTAGGGSLDKEASELNQLKPNGGSGSSMKRRHQRRKCCGNGMYCFCCSRRCCCIFLPILAVILVALGVTLFFVFPRIPEVTFSGVSVAGTNSATKDISISDLSDNLTVNRRGVVTVPLIISLNLTNPNFIPWTIHNVTVDGLLKNTTTGGEDYPVGEGGLVVPFNMPRKFNFHLDTNNTNYLDAAVIVQQACTAGGPQLRFRYHAKVIIKAISWLGIKPVISDTIKFDCPAKEIESLGSTSAT